MTPLNVDLNIDPEDFATEWAQFLNATGCDCGAVENFIENMLLQLQTKLYGNMVSVLEYGAIGDEVADDTDAIQAAIDHAHEIGNAAVMLPAGAYRTTSPITLPDGCQLQGAGYRNTRITYEGSGYAVGVELPGERKYGICITGLTIEAEDGALDLESVSQSLFIELLLQANTPNTGTGCRISAATAGYSVYNTFLHVTSQTWATCWEVGPIGCNESIWLGSRANNGATGFRIEHSNHNKLMGCAIESCTAGVVITASSPSITDANTMIGCRFENNIQSIRIDSFNIRLTVLALNHFVAESSNDIDNGDRTLILGNVDAGIWGGVKVETAKAEAPYHLRRAVSGGANLPCLHVEDSNSTTGVPVTVLATTERPAGSFFRGRRGDITYFDANADGSLMLAGHLAANQVRVGNTEGTADPLADDVVIGGTDVSGPGISILSSTTGAGRLYFGDSDSKLSGAIGYLHSTDRMLLRAGGVNVVRVTSDGLYPETSAAVDIGNESNRWSRVAVGGVSLGYRALGADTALTLAPTDGFIYLEKNTAGIIAAIMTTAGMIAGQVIHLMMGNRLNGAYTLAVSHAGGVGAITLDATGEACSIIFDGMVWRIASLDGATFV